MILKRPKIEGNILLIIYIAIKINEMFSHEKATAVTAGGKVE